MIKFQHGELERSFQKRIGSRYPMRSSMRVLSKKPVDYNVLIITENGKRTLASRTKIELPVELMGQRVLTQCGSKNSGIDAKTQGTVSKKGEYKRGEFLRTLDEDDVALYGAIKEWRKRTAEEKNVPPYVIFGDRTIENLILKKPRTPRELFNVSASEK